jgi:hypothetical protein
VWQYAALFIGLTSMRMTLGIAAWLACNGGSAMHQQPAAAPKPSADSPEWRNPRRR